MDHYEALERVRRGGAVLLLDFPADGEVRTTPSRARAPARTHHLCGPRCADSRRWRTRTAMAAAMAAAAAAFGRSGSMRARALPGPSSGG